MSMLVHINKRKKIATKGVLWIDYTSIGHKKMFRHFSKWFDSVYRELSEQGFILENKKS